MAHVLIMHTDEVVRARWQDLLSRDGHSCSAADSGDRTIELLAEAGSELLLCGSWQSRPADLEFVKSIRARFPGVAILLPSPAGDAPESRAVLDLSLAGYLVEPCADQQVSVGVAQAVRIRSREQRLVQQQAALERAIRERNLRLGASIDKLERARKTSDELARGFEEQVQMLRVLLDKIPNPICQFDSNGIVVSCNRSWEGVVGRSAEELVGLPALRALPFDMAEDYLLGTSSSSRSEGLNRELVLKFADGRVHVVLVYQADYDDTAGRTAGTVVVLLDITERKQAENEVISSERYLRAILDSILAGVIVLDASTREILDTNPRAAEMLGIKREEMVGRVCTDLICPTPEGQCPYSANLGRATEMKRTLIKGDGSELPAMKGVTRIDLDCRSLYIESFVDLTDRKRMELALRT